MKKTLVSLAAASLIVTGAMAADAGKKGVDFVTTGQAVIYYETKATDAENDAGFFHQDNSMANVGLQLDTTGNLGNGFTLGSQLTYLGTLGLEKNLVVGTRADGGQSLNNALNSQIMLSKVFIAKKVGNTTVKVGRQELPKSLSPFAFSEGWNVFKNTFDAALVVNTDIPDTTIVVAWVGEANDANANYGTMSDLDARTSVGNVGITGGAYMLTVANTSLPMTAITGSYYSLQKLQLTDGALALGQGSAAWLDVKVAGDDMPLGLSVGLQGGSIMLDSDNATLKSVDAKDTTAFGVKVGAKPIKPLYVQLAYTSVDDGTVAIKNVGGGIKSPLYTQSIYNQNFISRDASTIGVKAVYNAGSIGKFIANYNMTTDDSAAEMDYSELDLIYKVKSGGVTYWASAMLRDIDGEADNKVRLWARLGF